MGKRVVEINFTIHGNQDDPEGNPVPYVRSTQYGQFNPNVVRYNRWKDYVRDCFARELNEGVRGALHQKGITLEFLKRQMRLPNYQEIRMDIKIFWKNKAHGDPDNVWKGISDALFTNDRNVDGSFKSQLAPDGRGRVEVKINITP